MRHTKIIATVGPASDSDGTLDGLIAAGTDIFRLNFSHGTHESHAATYARIRAAAKRASREVAILQDLSGPKIRTGPLAAGRRFAVKPGDRLTIATGDLPGGPGRISTAFAGLARAVRAGDRLLLADGAVELRVDAANGTEIETTVVEGGEIGEHNGINAPGVPLAASAITPKDVSDLQFGVSLGVDLIALSFVQSAADLKQARQLLRRSLQRDWERHRFWMLVDLFGGVASIFLILLPGPNIIGYYFLFHIVGHFLSLRGARHGLMKITWTMTPSDALTAKTCLVISRLSSAARNSAMWAMSSGVRRSSRA